MGTIVGIIIVVGIVGLVVYLLVNKRKKVIADNTIDFTDPNQVNVVLPTSGPEDVTTEAAYHQTPGGMTVRCPVPIPDEALAALDRGVTHQITNSSHYNPGWTAGRNLSEYQIYFVKPMTHNVENDPGSPALIVNMLDAGMVVEHVQSAGTCIGVAGAVFKAVDPRYPSIVLPYQQDEGWSHLAYLEESARNESEHIAEWMNNRTMFFSFAIVGDVHPHFPDWPA